MRRGRTAHDQSNGEQSRNRMRRAGARLRHGSGPGLHNAYGFLTTSPNAVVEPIHPKAMPVILTTDEGRDV
jgi:putative SOS response-associated peptidase YedK